MLLNDIVDGFSKIQLYDPNPLCDTPPTESLELALNITLGISIYVYILTFILFLRKHEGLFQRIKYLYIWTNISYCVYHFLMVLIIKPIFYYSPPGFRVTGIWPFNHLNAIVSVDILLASVFASAYSIFRLFYFRMNGIVRLIKHDIVEKLVIIIRYMHYAMIIMMATWPLTLLVVIPAYADQPRRKEEANITLTHPEANCISAFIINRTIMAIVFTAVTGFVLFFIAIAIVLAAFTSLFNLKYLTNLGTMSEQTYRMQKQFLYQLIGQLTIHFTLFALPGLIDCYHIFFEIGYVSFFLVGMFLANIHGLIATIASVIILRKHLFPFLKVNPMPNTAVQHMVDANGNNRRNASPEISKTL